MLMFEKWELMLQKEWLFERSLDECIQFSTELKPPDRLNVYVASSMAGYS